MNKKFVVGVDVGGSHITAGLIDMANKSYVPNTEVRKRVNSHAPADEILGIWAATIAEVDPKGEYCIGMAMPGPFDYQNGIALIKGFNKYDELYGLNIRELLAERLNIKGEMIRFRNDAEAFLEGEVFCGAAKGFTDVIGITLGTGLGSAISKDGITIDELLEDVSNANEVIDQQSKLIVQKDAEIERLKEQLRTAYPLSDTLHNAQEQIKMLRESGQAIVDRWDTPNWKIVEATATYINALRYVLETTKPKE